MNILLRIKLKSEREMHRLAFRGQPISLERAMQLEASLAVPVWRTISLGSRVHNPYLAGVLAREELGAWALDFQTVDFLEREVRARRPQAILEFGTGLSTVCFARFMAESGNAPQPCVFSVEQNEWQAERSRGQLLTLGLDAYVRILHAPLKAQRIEGLQTECYDLPDSALREFLGGTRPDFIVVDGPSGDGTVRFGTLPLVQAYAAPQAVLFLDDAFRPEELDVAGRWDALPYVSLSGLRKVGKGLLMDRLVPVAAPAAPWTQ